MDKKTCIFDMDGTLVDSMGYWDRMQIEYLSAKGVAREVIDEVIELAKPLPLRASVELFIEKCALSDTVESVMEEMQDIMARHYREDVTAKAGIADYLAALRDKGARLCVASATEKALVESCLRRLGLAEYFEFFLSCSEVGAGKDRPNVFIEAACRLGATAAETAVFEDSLTAGRTAKQAGFYLAAVYDENSADEWEELSALADETVTDWDAATKTLRG